MRAALALGMCLAWPAQADTIGSATFSEPTTRYPHGVLGDGIEYGALTIGTNGPTGRNTFSVVLPADQVFEDLAPRLWDITGDGSPEIVVVHSSQDQGASLWVIGLNDAGAPQVLAATPPIGQRFRWLAPLGAADLDGDGRIEIAYIDRPHLAKTLRIWEFDGTALRPEAQATGLTNHRIGEDFISGGIRTCAGIAEVITANADWSQVMASRFDGIAISTRALGPLTDPDDLRAALDC